jgi:hypothetical protein
MASIPRLIASVVFALLGLALQGCAYLNPYVSIKASEFETAISGQLPEVGKSVKYLDGRIADVEDKGLQFGLEHRRLDVLTFGLATAAAAAPVYKAHRDLIAGLSMSAAAAYTGNALFAPAGTGELYASAVTALACVRGRASLFSGAVSLAVSDDGKNRLVASYESLLCSDPELRDSIDAAYIRARNLADRAIRSDGLAAAKFRQAGIAVLGALNKEIGSRTASSASILAAAKAVASGIAPEGSTTGKAAPKASIGFSMETCTEETTAAADATVGTVVDHFDRVSEVLTTALDSIEGLDKSCPMSVAAVPDLVVDRDAVTVTAGSEIYVRVSGGRPPYRSVWESDPKVISRSDVPDFVILRGAAQIAADGTHKLTIIDSSAVSRTKLITVISKKNSGGA